MKEFQAWPSWRYGPKGESAIFEKAEDVPKGWQDHPSKFEKAKKPKAEDGEGGGGDEGGGDDGENADTGGLTREQIMADLDRRKIFYKANTSTKSLYRILSDAIEAEA